MRRHIFSPLYSPNPFSLHRISAVMSTSHSLFQGCSSRSRGRGRRRFSDRSQPPSSTTPVSGDSHFQSVRDANSNLQHRHHHPYNNNEGNQFRLLNNKPRSSQSHRGPNFNPNANSDRSMTKTRPPDYRIWEFAKPPPPNAERFVVLSYNILADYLANSHRHLYYHIPHRFMSWDWRKKNILFELGLWSADIMCFQEVDKFDEFEEGLRDRGYSGVWKMRTGDPIDGCAIFWRTSRFKLVYEESIEFNKLSMRDNVAQICVLESLNENQSRKKLASSESTESRNRVVICNIHVLYNPRRGEMKLGQIRVLLERAQAVSKKWDDASVVLCGDFNCVPKSPLYNFISGQKLDISELDRANMSGQASADLRQSHRQYSYQTGGQSSGAITSSTVIQNLDVEKQITTDNTTDGSKSTEGTSAESDNQPDDSQSISSESVDEELVEDAEAFMSELNDSKDAFPSNLGVLGDPSFTRQSEMFNRPPYDPSSWTPMEIATATGNANNTVIEHSLKLSSTYTEVQDRSGTRDSNGEPLITSYHSCFMGTVDYIWRSEGLRTVKVLAPIPKSAMLPTQGFPSKKWGSDHIALASELAFTK